MTDTTARVQAQVIVVGAGNAGLVAALAAHEAGAKVLVLEAAPEELRGGNSRFSGGIFRITHEGTHDLASLLTEKSKAWAERVHIDPYTKEDYGSDFTTTSAGRADEDLVQVQIEQSHDVVKWMHERGVRWELAVGKLIDPEKIQPEERYVLPAGGCLRAKGEGVGLVQDLFDAVVAAGIQVRYDAPVTDLIMNGTTCEGVVISGPEGDDRQLGSVILASGGFEASPEARQRWLGPGWDLVKVRGTRFNHGVPLEASLRHGAQAYGHWGGCHAVPLDAAAPDVGELKMTDKYSRYSFPYGVMVNRQSRRFLDEGEDHIWLTYAKTGAEVRAQPGAWAAQIFDAKTVHLLEPRYSTGTPMVADSIPELAAQLGIEAAALETTIATYNEACTGGAFDAFSLDCLASEPEGQPRKSNWAQRIDAPPYTAYTVTCGITFTFGGLRINTQGSVMDFAGRVMPGLYATGEIAGGFFYHNYPAGSGLVRGAVFGRLAGQAAAERISQR